MTRGERVRAVLERIFRLGIGGLFVYAAWSKIQDPGLFAFSVASYRMLPSDLIGIFALVLPMVELVAGATLLATAWTRESSLVLLGLEAMFLVGLSQAAVRGLDISCGCFGEEAGKGGSVYAALLRDLLLIPPTAWLARRPNCWMWRLRPRAACALVALVALCGAAVAAEAPATNAVARQSGVFGGLDTVSPAVAERWTGNFPDALAKARAERKPLILFLPAEGCGPCRRLAEVLEGKMFRKWIEGTGIYLSEAHLRAAKDDPVQRRQADFMKATEGWKRADTPYVGVYWPKSPTEEVRVVFTGRRGEMPGGRYTALVIEFVSAIEKILGDYLRTVPPRPKTEELLKCAVKKLSVAADEGGSVTMRPESGELLDDVSSFVSMTATPAEGKAVLGWRGPDGEFVRNSFRRVQLNLWYGSTREGTYTAVFVDKAKQLEEVRREMARQRERLNRR